MSALERGYKSWCERFAIGIRSELKIAPEAPLSARTLAEHLGVRLITPHDIPGLLPEDLRQLTIADPSGWSAVSFSIDGQTTVIYNPKNSFGRQSSDIMHEIAHVLCEHEPSQLILLESGALAMRSFDARQEDEANWLGWTILLPRPALVYCAKQRLTTKEIAQHYAVSERLVMFRRGVTGVDLHARRRTRFAR